MLSHIGNQVYLATLITVCTIYVNQYSVKKNKLCQKNRNLQILLKKYAKAHGNQ